MDEAGDVLKLLACVRVKDAWDVFEEGGRGVAKASGAEDVSNDMGAFVIEAPHVADG